MPAMAIDTQVANTLAAAIASVSRFDATCATTGWFGDDVLWLDPQPSDGFRGLTSAVVAAFPSYLPYSGEYDDVIPHLTVGHDAVDELRDRAAGPAAPAGPGERHLRRAVARK